MKHDLMLVGIVAFVAVIGMLSLAFIAVPTSSSSVQTPVSEQTQEVVLDDPALAQWSQQVSTQQQLQPEDVQDLIGILERSDDAQARMLASQIKEDIYQSNNLYGFATDGPLSFVPDEFSFEDDRVWYDSGKTSYGIGKVGKGYGFSVKFKF